MLATFTEAVRRIRAAGRAAASAPYWGMALLSAADNGGDVDIDPKKSTTRFTFTNPKRPKAGHTLTLQGLFPHVLPGTIDGAVKQGVHFAHAARVAGVAGAKTAVTADQWRTLAGKYGVEYEGIRKVAGPLADWYRDDDTDKTPTAFRAVIEEALNPTVADDDEPDDTEPDTDTDDDTSNHPFVAMVETAGYPKRRDRLEAWLVEALEADAVKTGGTGLVSRTCLLGASIVQRQKDEADAAVVAAGADAQTLAPTGTDG